MMFILIACRRLSCFAWSYPTTLSEKTKIESNLLLCVLCACLVSFFEKVGRHEPIPLPMGRRSCPGDDAALRSRTRESAIRSDRILREEDSPGPGKAML